MTVVSAYLPSAPSWLDGAIILESLTGSIAYGASVSSNDYDFVGIVVPPLPELFPHLTGAVPGLRQHSPFSTLQKQHVPHPDWGQFDVTYYNVVDFMRLAAQGNPNIIEVLFFPHRCLVTGSDAGQMLLDNKELLLSSAAWHRFKGMAWNQYKVVINPQSAPESRQHLVQQYGYDTKGAYHMVRILLQAKQLLSTGTMTLDANGAYLQEVRNGKYSFVEINTLFTDMMAECERVFLTTSLRPEPDWDAINRLLLDVLAEFYGKTTMQFLMPGVYFKGV